MQRFAYLPADTPFGLAHRGGNEVAAENTIAAFEHALSLGVDHLETDVHVTADGVLVAFHDAGLERVAGLAGAIADHRWSDLERLDLGSGQGIPTLATLFERFPRAKFNIDPKHDAAVDPLVDLIREHDAVDRVCIGAFSDARIARASAALGPDLCTSAGPRHIAMLWAAAQAGRAVRGTRAAPLAQRIAAQHGCLQVPSVFRGIRLVESHLIEMAHRLGLQVHVWTINEAAEMHDLLDAGVDALISDRVSVLRDVLTARSSC